MKTVNVVWLMFITFIVGVIIGSYLYHPPREHPYMERESLQYQTITQVSISYPDPHSPGGFVSQRLKVVTSGTEQDALGPQKNDQWNLVLWLRGSPPYSYFSFRCVPISH